jgi:hypothetical protein
VKQASILHRPPTGPRAGRAPAGARPRQGAAAGAARGGTHVSARWLPPSLTPPPCFPHFQSKQPSTDPQPTDPPRTPPPCSDKEQLQSALEEQRAASSDAAHRLAGANESLAAATALADEREKELAALRRAAEGQVERHEEAAREAAAKVRLLARVVRSVSHSLCTNKPWHHHPQTTHRPQMSQLQRDLVHSQDTLAARDTEVRGAEGPGPRAVPDLFFPPPPPSPTPPLLTTHFASRPFTPPAGARAPGGRRHQGQAGAQEGRPHGGARGEGALDRGQEGG